MVKDSVLQQNESS